MPEEEELKEEEQQYKKAEDEEQEELTPAMTKTEPVGSTFRCG